MKQRPSSARVAATPVDSAPDSLYSKLKDDILKRAKANALSSSTTTPNRSPRAMSNQFSYSLLSPDKSGPSFSGTPTKSHVSGYSARPSSAHHSFTSTAKASPPPRPPIDVSPRPPVVRPPISHTRPSYSERWRQETIETVPEPSKPLTSSTRTSRCAIMNLMVRLASKCRFGHAMVELRHSGLIELQTPNNRSKALQYILGKHDESSFAMCCPEHHLLVARILWTNGDFEGSKNWYKTLQVSQAPVGETNAVQTLSHIVDDSLFSLRDSSSDARPLLLKPQLSSLTSIDAVIDVFSKVPPLGSFLLVRKALALIHFGRLHDALQAVKSALRHSPEYCEALILDDLLRVAVDETRDIFSLPLECVPLRCSDDSHFVCKSWDSTRLSVITSIRRAQALRFEAQVEVLQACVAFLKAEQSDGLDCQAIPQPLVRQITFRCLAMRATILRKMGDHGGATEAIAELISDRPDDKQLHRSFLQCLMDEKRSGDAFLWLTEDPRALVLFSKEEVEALKMDAASSFAHYVASQSSSGAGLTYHFSKCDSNPFLVLGLVGGTNTARSQLKKSYRAACLQWHPDKWSSHSQADKAISNFCFQMISRAYEAAQRLIAS